MKRLATFGALLFLVSVLVGCSSLADKVRPSTDPCPVSDTKEADQALNQAVSVTMVFAEPSPISSSFAVYEGSSIAINGYVLTAAHVVKKAHTLAPSDVEISVMALGSSSARIPTSAELVYYNEVADVALLKSSSLLYAGGTEPPALEFASANDLKLDTPVCVFSVTGGFVRGIIATPEFENDYSKSWFAFGSNDFWVAKGSSGGPIYARINGKLEIIGIVIKRTFVHHSEDTMSGALGVDIVEAVNLINAEMPGLLDLKPVE